MQIENRPWSHKVSGADVYTGRIQECRELAHSLALHVGRVRQSAIDRRIFRNVLTFYGISGMGKTELSTKLNKWVVGEIADTDEWGPRPVEGILSARWDFNDSLGNVDVLTALIAVRNEFGRVKRVWPAFDLAFVAYYTALHPGEAIPALGSKDSGFARGMVDILGDIASDLGVAAGTVVNLSVATVRLVTNAALSQWRKHKALAAMPDFEVILDRCATEPASGIQSPDLAAELLWLLTAEVELMDEAARPILVIFIDHFERLQGQGRRGGEHIVNRLVASLPYSLFVVTGKNELDWARDDRTELDVAGSRVWPNLVPSSTVGSDQHELAWLADEEIRDLANKIAARKQLELSPETVEQIVAATGGWPVHIVAVMTYAETLCEKDPLHRLSPADVGTSFTEIIDQLLEDLPDDEARVLRAACVLPYFDLELVSSIAWGVDQGSIVRLCDRSIVSPNEGSVYPFRIHDQLRRTIRAAGAHVRHGWSESDWRAAVGRAIEAAWGRHSSAVASKNDEQVMQAVALVITLCIEHTTFDDRLVSAVRTAPSITGLKSMLPPSDAVVNNPEIMNLLKHIEALALPSRESVLRSLDEVSRSGTQIASSGGLWRAYRLRKALRFDEALDQLEFVLELDPAPKRKALFRRQKLITLAQARRFQQAVAGLPELDESKAAFVMDAIERDCGNLSHSIEILGPRIASASSRRFELELEGDLLLARTRVGDGQPDEARSLMATAIAVGHSTAERFAATALAMLSLFDDDEFYKHLRRVDEIEEMLAIVASPVSLELVALRALATGDSGDLARRYDDAEVLRARSSAWIGTEVFLELLGHQLSMVETQWLEPYENVSERWRRIAETVIERARAISVSGKPE